MKHQLLAAALAAALSFGSAAHAQSTAGSNIETTAETMGSTSDPELAQIRSQLQNLLQRVDRLEVENDTLKAENRQLKSQTEQISEQLAERSRQSARRAGLQAGPQSSQAAGMQSSGMQSSQPSSQLSGPQSAGRLNPADDASIPALKAADWPNRIAIKGDLRYRHQQTDDASAGATREEDLLRARLSVEARVNDRMVAAVGFATSSAPGNPRGGNVQLDGAFSRKSLYLDFAYFDWTIAGDAHLIGGKMKMPFERPGQSLFWDNDINPEGLAVTYSAGSFFGSMWSYWIDENVPAGTATPTSTTADTKMYGLQFGNRFAIGGNDRAGDLTIAASYYDLAAAEGRRPFYSGANGNSLTATGGLAYDFQVLGLMLEYDTKIGGLPLQLWGDFAKNLDAEFDTAFTFGTLAGKASNPGTWETGLAYQVIEKDALFAQHIDSDFGGGLSDSQGWVLRAGYAPSRNWVLNATYFKNQNHRDVGTRSDFDRFMLDFNTKF